MITNEDTFSFSCAFVYVLVSICVSLWVCVCVCVCVLCVVSRSLTLYRLLGKFLRKLGNCALVNGLLHRSRSVSIALLVNQKRAPSSITHFLGYGSGVGPTLGVLGSTGLGCTNLQYMTTLSSCVTCVFVSYIDIVLCTHRTPQRIR